MPAGPLMSPITIRPIEWSKAVRRRPDGPRSLDVVCFPAIDAPALAEGGLMGCDQRPPLKYGLEQDTGKSPGLAGGLSECGRSQIKPGCTPESFG